ncbi:hypothetical protein V8C86DRAFT_2515561 [Haematococcus lacustris]|nr:hypothetical protein QJQ45_019803 [Haematococcus lacustris]
MSTGLGGVTECKAFAVVEKDKIQALAGVLRGLCTRYAEVEYHELALQVPLAAGTKCTTLKLVRRVMAEPAESPWVEPQLERWLVQHEGLPLQTPAARKLAAAVREVSESVCLGSNQLDFWLALGAKQLQEGTRKGNEYHCVCEGHDLKAYLFKFVKAWQLVPGTNTRQPITEERFILEVTARVAEGQHVNAARAIGILAQKLTALVALQPAIIPM